MLTISRLTVSGVESGLVTDEAPSLSFALGSDIAGETLAQARISVDDWETRTTDQVGIVYTGPLVPYTDYPVKLTAIGASGETAEAVTSFRTGRMNTAWRAQWITDLAIEVPDKTSPVPMRFRRRFTARGPVKRAWVEATALGIYELELNGEKVGEDYFAPGFTSYHHQIQYQTYDLTDRIAESNEVLVTVGGGWAVGVYTTSRKSKTYADRQAFLCEVHLEYEDGTSETVSTGTDWEVCTDGPFRMAEWYDGETFDATFSDDLARWKQADVTKPEGTPQFIAQYGPPVRVQQSMTPVSVTTSPSGEVIYDFGQNFAGVVRARLRGAHGQRIVFRHAEVLVDDELFVTSLRTAKATATYTCVDGEQTYSPRLTYMGFRYVGVRGIEPDDLELSALVLHSDLPQTGSFSCSNDSLNALQSAIVWGGRSNFVEIPTDCPQRDEREGWTGDLAVFASTATYNFDMSRFLGKWLRDVAAEQGRGGGIPMVVPRAGKNIPVMASSCWGDVCIIAPWEEYLARGDRELLRRQYPTMKRFLKATKWWAGFGSIRPQRRLIWRLPFHWGDWTAPNSSSVEWILRTKWIATAYFAHSAALLARIAELLGEPEDAAHYGELSERIAVAYRKVFTDGHGRLKKKEFQSAYVLPLAFGLAEGEEAKAMADNLARLISEAGGHLATGFPATPHILFALSDHGRLDEAYDLLLQTDSPSWLYMVESGGTTIWERWDALRPDGTVNVGELFGPEKRKDSSGGMVSFNHYAAGAVGDWMYRRIAGIEPTTGGYRTFRIVPLPGGGLTSARGHVHSPYGLIRSEWTRQEDTFSLTVEVPVSTVCTIVLPDGTSHVRESGTHELTCRLAR